MPLQVYPFPMMFPGILFTVVVYFLELGSESLNVDPASDINPT